MTDKKKQTKAQAFTKMIETKAQAFTKMIENHLNEMGFPGNNELTAMEAIVSMYEDGIGQRTIIKAKFTGIDETLYFNSRTVLKAFAKSVRPLNHHIIEHQDITVITPNYLILNEKKEKYC